MVVGLRVLDTPFMAGAPFSFVLAPSTILRTISFGIHLKGRPCSTHLVTCFCGTQRPFNLYTTLVGGGYVEVTGSHFISHVGEFRGLCVNL